MTRCSATVLDCLPSRDYSGRVDAPTKFTEADEYILDIAEKRFALEEDSNKTFQQKAALLMAAVGFFVSFVGQMFLKLAEAWQWHATQWIAGGMLVATLGVLLVAAFFLLTALFGQYSTPASPRKWGAMLDESRQRLGETPEADTVALHHVQREYLGKLYEAAEAATCANATKSKQIELATNLLRLYAAPFVLLAVLTFLIQALAVPAPSNKAKECPMADKPAENPAPADSGPAQGGGDTSTPSGSSKLPSAPPNEISRKSASDEGIVRVDYKPGRGRP